MNSWPPTYRELPMVAKHSLAKTAWKIAGQWPGSLELRCTRQLELLQYWMRLLERE